MTAAKGIALNSAFESDRQPNCLCSLQSRCFCWVLLSRPDSRAVVVAFTVWARLVIAERPNVMLLALNQLQTAVLITYTPPLPFSFSRGDAYPSHITLGRKAVSSVVER